MRKSTKIVLTLAAMEVLDLTVLFLAGTYLTSFSLDQFSNHLWVGLCLLPMYLAGRYYDKLRVTEAKNLWLWFTDKVGL